MQNQTKQMFSDFFRQIGSGAFNLLLAALVLICISMLGFAILFSDAEVAGFINLLFGN